MGAVGGRGVEFTFDKIHAFDVADDNVAQLVDRGNQACGPDCRHHMDHARHLFFEPAVARSAVGTGGGVCCVRDLGVLAVAPAAHAGSGTAFGGKADIGSSTPSLPGEGNFAPE